MDTGYSCNYYNAFAVDQNRRPAVHEFMWKQMLTGKENKHLHNSCASK